ncbi:antitoxin [Kocuria sp. M4R2S49]|uniref:antitoxin n=1 Tax=Kocuria rhizosphaericola TaxID=3376284 RepID=UPI0037BD507E
MVDMGGFADKAKNLADQHPDKVEQGIDRGGDAVDERTDKKYESQVDQGQEKAGDFLGTGEQDQEDQQQN